MPGNQLTLGSARLDRKPGGSCVAPGDREIATAKVLNS